jgi:hypothetical protein
MELLSDFFTWAWARHHNVLSWYIRPLFILPYIYFAYKRNWKGLAVTIVSLATSMFWFPAPETVDPAVEQFLQAERDYLLGTWGFYFLALAFWKRSWWWGAAVINLAAFGKIAWSVAEGGESGWAILVPAMIGLLICNAAVYFGVKFANRKKMQLA